MLADEATVGRDLCAVAPRVVAHDDHGAALRVGAGEVADGQRVRRDVHADALHCRNGAAGRHLRAVDGRDAERLVVRLERADAVVLEQVLDVAQGVEEAGDGRAGIAGQEVDAAVGLEGAFDEQLIAGEDFSARLGQEAGIACHVSVVPWAASATDVSRRDVK